MHKSRFQWRSWLWLCAGLWLGFSASAQVPDSILLPEGNDSLQLSLRLDSLKSTLPFDSTGQKRDKTGWFYKASDYPNPKRALIYAFAFPGGGQIYNKKWYKLPFAYGALFGLGYWIHSSTNNYLIYERAYRRKVRGLPHDLTGTAQDNAATLESFRNQFDKSRQTSYIIFAVGYSLIAIEAFVDAHLSTFDVSDDLSWRLKPSLELGPGAAPAVGVGLQIRF